MSVNTPCGKCNEPLIDEIINVEGSDVQVSKCPNDHGKIKSPSCCGHEMTCQI